jgi:hypothetical protein
MNYMTYQYDYVTGQYYYWYYDPFGYTSEGHPGVYTIGVVVWAARIVTAYVVSSVTDMGGAASQNLVAPTPDATLTCSPSTLVRGSTITCTASSTVGTPAFSNWQFQDGQNTTVSSSGTGSTWSGIMVKSGTVKVTVTVGGVAMVRTRAVTVNPRSNWAFSAAAAAPRDAGYTCGGGRVLSFGSPPSANEEIGKYCVNLPYSYMLANPISGGPNSGYRYINNASAGYGDIPTEFSWAEHQDLANSTSTFSQAQCGNYNSQTQSGFISRSNLVAGTDRHEAGSSNSHWAKYSAANGGSNNLGVVMESQVAPPGTTESAFRNTITTNAGTAIQAIADAADKPEPCSPNYNSTCTVFNGPINYSPYQACQ